ncbi:TRAP transporter small permease [Salipiger abyssi]|uniref:TRAP transporter small permease protein n=1 Tax=Salipiger abyssi TaxID=1250539 RepID=A0A1P8UQZ3_9RHOB|nr:TRAP transporter small permease [Salipiger abyssi]APZ51825.1 TRAP-type C4-dicarboxylate transport system, small permease component [Salipiger abyssi]
MTAAHRASGPKAGQSSGIARALARADRVLARIEMAAAAALVAGLSGVLAAAALARAMARPLIWADELAVLLMAMACFLGASALLARDGHVAVTALTDRLPRRARAWALLAREALLMAVIVVFALLVWRWFDPLAPLRPPPEPGAFVLPNFLYQEPTATLGLRKLWFWLALPVFCLGALCHMAVRLGRALRGLAC